MVDHVIGMWQESCDDTVYREDGSVYCILTGKLVRSSPTCNLSPSQNGFLDDAESASKYLGGLVFIIYRHFQRLAWKLNILNGRPSTW